MNSKLLIGVVAVGIIGVSLYLWQMQSPLSTTEVSEDVKTNAAVSTTEVVPQIVWHLSHARYEKELGDIPVTSVKLEVDGKRFDAGTIQGGCYEQGSEANPLDADALSGVSCWYAGGGAKYSVFREGGKLVLKMAYTDEGIDPQDEKYVLKFPLEVTQKDVTFSAGAEQAYTLSDEELKAQLIAGMNTLLTKYDTELGFKMSAFLHEYVVVRGLKGIDVDDLAFTMAIAYGPCWGIPEGECRE